MRFGNCYWYVGRRQSPQRLKMLEDMGYFCVDNLPIPLLIQKFAEMSGGAGYRDVDKAALGT